MNEWSIKTIQLVTTQNYLDKLQEIYPHEEGERIVEDDNLKSVKAAFEGRKDIELLNLLLNLKKFPYKDSYVGFLRKDKSAIERNPLTVKRICDRLYEMGLDSIIRGVKAKKEANTRRGNKFPDWARREFKMVGIEEFKASRNGIVLLNTSELEAKDFCNREMGVGLSKRPDLVAKSDNSYVIGEAKFLSQFGGNQDRGFDDGMALAKKPSGNAYKVFILDGVYWIESDHARYKQIEYSTAAVFSVLLLNEFLKNVAHKEM